MRITMLREIQYDADQAEHREQLIAASNGYDPSESGRTAWRIEAGIQLSRNGFSPERAITGDRDITVYIDDAHSTRIIVNDRLREIRLA